jgi:trimethylamine:corrinoid methyltransferase-like protein
MASRLPVRVDRKGSPLLYSKEIHSMILSDVLSEGQVSLIMEKTEEILERTGLGVTHPVLLARCRAAGARIDEAEGRVRFPRPVLRELLAAVPESFTIVGAGGLRHVVGDDTAPAAFLAIVTDPWIIDYESGEPRRPRLDDLRRHTAIAQALPMVVATSLMDFPLNDVPEPISSLRAMEEWALGNDKHFYNIAPDMARYRHYLALAEILFDGRDPGGAAMTVAVGSLSPLACSDLNADFLLDACSHGFPVVPTVCPIAGMTSPYSVAGTLLQSNAEVIGMAALTQAARHGNPYLYASGLSVGHMRSTHDMYYTLDKVLWKTAAVQLGKAYSMPVAAECGGSMTYRYDQQNGAEGMLFMLGALSSGAHLLSGIGSTFNAIGMSAEMMLIHTVWLAASQYLQRGIRTDDLRLAVENIERAGPGGNFLIDDLTLHFLRSDEFFPHALLDYTGGSEPGAPSLLACAHQRAEEIAGDARSPHSEAVQERIRRYFADEYRKLGAQIRPEAKQR